MLQVTNVHTYIHTYMYIHTCTYISVHTYMYIVHCLPLSPEKWDRGQVTGYRGQVTSDKSPRPLATIRVVILKFFKTILRPWQAGVLKKEIICVNGACHFEEFF